jgi:hypothetical protein
VIRPESSRRPRCLINWGCHYISALDHMHTLLQNCIRVRLSGGMVRASRTIPTEARTIPTEIAKEALNRECFLYETFLFIHDNVSRCQLDV